MRKWMKILDKFCCLAVVCLLLSKYCPCHPYRARSRRKPQRPIIRAPNHTILGPQREHDLHEAKKHETKQPQQKRKRLLEEEKQLLEQPDILMNAK